MGRVRGAAVSIAGQDRTGTLPKIFVRLLPVTISQAMKVTKWSSFSGDFDVNNQQAEPTFGETGFVGPAASHSSDAESTPAATSMQGLEGSMQEPASVDAPKLVPGQGGADEMPRVDSLKDLLKRLTRATLKLSNLRLPREKLPRPKLPREKLPRLKLPRPKLPAQTRRAPLAGP
jgi:hypothetical protein